LAVCNAINNQSAIDLKYLGSSGILCTWKDERTLPIQIYTQLISINGLVQLSTNGLQLSFGLKALNPNTVKDGLGGAIIAWQDSSALGWDIKSQKINSVGSLQWPVGGAIVSNAIYDQVSVTLTSDGTGGAIYLWEDERNLSNTEIYAHHLFFTGTSVVGLNDQPLTSPIISVYPNPANEFIVFNFQNVDDFQNANLEIRNINGSSVLKVNTFIIQNQITLSNLNLANGLYHYTITMFDTTNILKGKLIISH
jgi:hypothetical protein